MKFKVLLLSAIFTATVEFESHAMLEQEQEERAYVSQICRRFPTSSAEAFQAFETYVNEDSKGKARKPNRYGVPTAEFSAALYFYNKCRVAGGFGPLEALFKKMPKEYRVDAFSFLNAFVDSDTLLYCKSLKEFSGLKERLLGFPPPEEG